MIETPSHTTTVSNKMKYHTPNSTQYTPDPTKPTFYYGMYLGTYAHTYQPLQYPYHTQGSKVLWVLLMSAIRSHTTLTHFDHPYQTPTHTLLSVASSRRYHTLPTYSAL
jgi:hypothetical protein